MPGPIAYLNSEYPSLSHTFIEREVRELRRRGADIVTFSVKPTTATGRKGAAHAEAASSTIVLRPSASKLLVDAGIGAISSPGGFIRALLRSQKLAPPGVSSRIKHVGYVLQGIRLARQMRARQIGHVHVHMANNGAAIAMMASVFDPRLTYSLSIHGSAEFFHVDSWTLAPKVESALFVRCISNFCKAQIMAWVNPECWDRLHVVHCGVDPDVYTPRPPRAPGRLRLLTVGRLHPIKGYEMLLHACAELKRRGLDWEMDMVGDGPRHAALVALAGELGIADRVTFSGAVDQDRITAHFDRADMLVISSFMEGVPVVMMEAMAKRLAVLATRVGGIPELVRGDGDGQLVDPGSVESLADGLEPFAIDPDRCERYGTAARERIEREYSVNGLGAGMMELFRNAGLVTGEARHDHAQQTVAPTRMSAEAH